MPNPRIPSICILAALAVGTAMISTQSEAARAEPAAKSRGVKDPHKQKAAVEPAHSAPGNAAITGQRKREGAKLCDVPGRFDFTGDRMSFVPAEGEESFRVLENLAMERIGVVLTESREKPQWIVSGIVTEYRGSNYLLVTKEVLQAPSAPSRAPYNPR